jgi:hypothetical protein
MVEGNESLPSGEAVNDTLKGLLDSAYEKWEAGDCHDPGCGCVTEYMRRELIPFIEQAIRAEVQAAIQDLFCEKHKDTGIAASEGYLWDECPTCEIQIAEANALRKAAEHRPMIAIDGTASKVWVYCSCGFNRDSTTYETDPEEWTKHMLDLTPVASQTLLDARDAEVRLKEAEWLTSHAPGRLPQVVQDHIDELRAASQPTQGGNNERSRG